MSGSLSAVLFRPSGTQSRGTSKPTDESGGLFSGVPMGLTQEILHAPGEPRTLQSSQALVGVEIEADESLGFVEG